MDYVSLALILAIVGFALIVAELFIPSGGMISILCVVAFVVSLWFAYRGWWERSPAYFWTFASSLLVGIPIFVLGIFRVLESTRLGDRILLSAPSLDDVTPYQQEEQRLGALIGRKGRALTMLNPGGLVRVEGERLHAFSEGVIVDPEEWIEVLEVRGTRVLVRRTTPPDERTAPAPPAATDLARDESPETGPASEQLDFDLPQS